MANVSQAVRPGKLLADSYFFIFFIYFNKTYIQILCYNNHAHTPLNQSSDITRRPSLGSRGIRCRTVVCPARRRHRSTAGTPSLFTRSPYVPCGIPYTRAECHRVFLCPVARRRGVRRFCQGLRVVRDGRRQVV